MPGLCAVGNLFADMEGLVITNRVVGEPVFGIDLALCDLVTARSKAGLGGMQAASASGSAAEDDLSACRTKGGNIAWEICGKALFEFSRLDEV